MRSAGTPTSATISSFVKLGDRDDGVRRLQRAAQPGPPVQPVPARERLRVAQDREVVDGEDDRRAEPGRAAERRAVEEVEAASVAA